MKSVEKVNVEKILDQLASALGDLNQESVAELVGKAFEVGLDPNQIVLKGLSPGLEIVGQRYEAKEYFLADLLMAAHIMKSAVETLRPHLEKEKVETEFLGRVVIGTVQGDIHDIGKNLVVSMLSLAGFDVYDIGIDVPPGKFVAEVKKADANIVAMSALLTMTAPMVKNVIDALKKAGLTNKVKTLVGGRAVTREFAKQIGADGYGEDAIEAVAVAKELIRKTQV